MTVRPEKIRIGAGHAERGLAGRAARVVEQVYLGSLSQTVVELSSR